MPEKLTIRQSYLSMFLKSPSEFLKRWNDKDSFKPNSAMIYGTNCHREREKENGEFGEIKIIIDMGICNLSGTLDYYNGEIIKDYKYTGCIEKFEGYKNQICVYQYLVWKKYNKLVPAILEMNEVDYNPFNEVEYTTTGKILEHKFKKPTTTDLISFEKKVVSSLRQMLYLMEKAKQPKPTRPKSSYTPSQLKEMSADLPEEMRTRNAVRYSVKK
jgi:hypothetical protein